MLEKIKELFKPNEEEMHNDWNNLLKGYSEEIEKMKQEYKELENSYWSMNEKELLKEIAINTLRIRKHFDLHG